METKKRMSISIPTELEKRLAELRKTDRFCRSSYAEIIRCIMDVGITEIKRTVNLDDPATSNRRAG